MKRTIAIATFLVIAAIATAFSAYTLTTDNHHAKCTGSKYCSACKNCSGCAHCAKNGGSCGVCKK